MLKKKSTYVHTAGDFILALFAGLDSLNSEHKKICDSKQAMFNQKVNMWF